MKHLRVLSFLLITMTTLAACNADYEAMAKERLKYARKHRGPIVVGVMINEDPSFYQGVELAAKEINQHPHKLLGRPVILQKELEYDTIEDTIPSIQRITANPRVVAVLGHGKSEVAIPASAIYERSQVLFLSSFSIAEKLTGHRFKYVFRMMPNTKVLATQQASMASTLGYKKMVILHSRRAVSREHAFLFEDAAIDQGIQIIKRASFFSSGGERNYRPIISQFTSESFDAILISSDAESSGEMARQLREMGLQQPIIGNSALRGETYNKAAGELAADLTIVPSIYNTDTKNHISARFAEKYQQEYETPPNQKAAQGYDSMNLLARGIRSIESTLGPTLSSTFRYLPAWVGVTGIHAFDEDGELRGKKYFFQVWRQNQLIELPAIHHFYLLDRLVQNIKTKYGTDYPVTDFAETFKQRMHEDDHKTYLLDLAHELIRFKRIGIIYENNEAGKIQAEYNLLKKFADRKNANYRKYLARINEPEEDLIELIECQIPFSLLDEKEAERELFSCYGSLSLNMDVLLAPSYYRNANNPDIIKQLDAALGSYKIPSISVNPQSGAYDTSIKLTRRTDLKLNSDEQSPGMQAYNGLLNGIKIHEFHEQLVGLPEIRVNLTDLQQDDLPEEPILDISTDAYLDLNKLLRDNQNYD